MGIKGNKGYGTAGIGEGLWYESVIVVAVITMITITRAQMKIEREFKHHN